MARINDYYKNTVGGEQKDFVDFVKASTEGLNKEHLKDVDHLVHKIAKNMFYFEDNIETAKTDFITLIGMLINKGVIFKK